MTAELDAVRAELANVRAALARADAAVERLVQAAANTPLNGLFPIPEADERRRERRPGVVPKIDADPELRAFVAARVDRMTFQALAAAVVAAFPPERRVGRSAIHAWSQRNRGAR